MCKDSPCLLNSFMVFEGAGSIIVGYYSKQICSSLLMFSRIFHTGGMMSLAVRSKTADTVKCEVIDGGELKSRRHLNVRGKSATLPSITGRIHVYQHTLRTQLRPCCKRVMIPIFFLLFLQKKTGKTSSLVLITKLTFMLSHL